MSVGALGMFIRVGCYGWGDLYCRGIPLVRYPTKYRRREKVWGLKGAAVCRGGWRWKEDIHIGVGHVLRVFDAKSRGGGQLFSPVSASAGTCLLVESSDILPVLACVVVW
jgi:hypothetical protein